MQLDKLKYKVLLEYCQYLQEYIISSTNFQNSSELYFEFVKEKILEGS